MMEVIALETLEDLDKNNDGFVDVDEYLGDIGASAVESETEQKIVAMEDDEFDNDPNLWDAPGIDENWIENEKRIFNDERDIDGDGFLNMAEVMLWMNPPVKMIVIPELEFLGFRRDSIRSRFSDRDERQRRIEHAFERRSFERLI